VSLVIPHGGELCALVKDAKQAKLAREKAADLESLTLSHRQLCDIELLLNGGFSPLKGFLTREQYDGVLENMRLPSGDIWPIPITLDVSEKFQAKAAVGQSIALRDQEGVLLAILKVKDKWKPDKMAEAERVFGSQNREHPAIDYLMSQAGAWYLGGDIEGVELPRHYDFEELRLSPKELRAHFESQGIESVVAFQTRNPMHRAHQELTMRAATEAKAHLLIQPVVGMTKPGDIDHYTRVRCYKKTMSHYPKGQATLSLLPLAMRMGGPREAVWHAIIRKNYGCSHFIVGRDHAGPGKDKDGKEFYGAYDAQELLKQHQDELGIKMVPFKMMVYVQSEAAYQPVDEIAKDTKTLSISGTELRDLLNKGAEIPEWFSWPDVVKELRANTPKRGDQGFTVFFTGLSGSGKSTVANVLLVKLLELQRRQVTLLDGDIVRTHLSSELGFSKEHRSLNIRRIGFVASEITKHRGIVICAPIAPYSQDRLLNRQLISPLGGYVEFHIKTPIEECEKRDRKGLYQKARQGLIKGFTGIDDPYEAPNNPELAIDTTNIIPEDAANQIIKYLKSEGYL
jgi:sulfate adenylyltransferase